MSASKCMVLNCNVTVFNMPPGVSLHTCPAYREMRNKWHNVLKNKCPVIDWTRSKICSKHFESKCFDFHRNLRDNAIPSLFPSSKPNLKIHEPKKNYKIDKLLDKIDDSELEADIESSLDTMEVTDDITKYITDDLKCKPNSPIEAEMWLLIKKQEHLNTRLKNGLFDNQKNMENSQNKLDETKSTVKEMEQNIETYKYIVKCLQEKLSTLEERIEILTSVESR